MQKLCRLAIAVTTIIAALSAGSAAHAELPTTDPSDRAPRVELGFSPFVAFGIAPGTSFGGALTGGVHWPSIQFSLAAEVHVDSSNRASLDVFPQVQATTIQVGGALVRCWRPLFFLVCGVATYGEMYPTATGTTMSKPEQIHLHTFRAGGRVGLGAMVREHLGLRLYGDVLGAILPAAFVIAGQEAWRTRPISGDVGATILGSF